MLARLLGDDQWVDDTEYLVHVPRHVEGVRHRASGNGCPDVAGVARLDAVNRQRRRDYVVVLDERSCTGVRRRTDRLDAGRELDELFEIRVRELVLVSLDGRAAEVLDGLGQRLDVSLLVVADRTDLLEGRKAEFRVREFLPMASDRSMSLSEYSLRNSL